MWDMRTRSMISSLKEHSSRVVGLAVLDDDQHVVSASRDRSIITWDLIRERRVSSHQQRIGTGLVVSTYHSHTTPTHPTPEASPRAFVSVFQTSSTTL